MTRREQRWQDQPWRYEGCGMDDEELGVFDRARIGVTRSPTRDPQYVSHADKARPPGLPPTSAPRCPARHARGARAGGGGGRRLRFGRRVAGRDGGSVPVGAEAG